jgi:nicotinamide-nucleotide amidase
LLNEPGHRLFGLVNIVLLMRNYPLVNVILVIAEVICVGNELLLGTIDNTNARWISKKIAEAGGFVKRISVVGDEIDEISLAIKESLARKPDWLIITGGLGPTYDDKTLEAVAVALGGDLFIDNAAVEMLKKSYARYSLNYNMDEIRLKMARIPNGAIPIQNPVGTAPSIILKNRNDNANTNIVCLPGVPEEMKAIFIENILTKIKEIIGDFNIFEGSYEVTGASEAELAPVLSQIVDSHPRDSIYLKTHPRGYTNDNKPKLRIQIVSKGKDESKVQLRYNNISNTLIEEIKKLNGTVLFVGA